MMKLDAIHNELEDITLRLKDVRDTVEREKNVHLRHALNALNDAVTASEGAQADLAVAEDLGYL